MKTSKNPSPQTMRLVAAAIIALSLAACSKEADDTRSPGKKLDDGIAKMEQQSDALKADVQRGANDAALAASAAAQSARQAANDMREQVGSDLTDVGISTTVKARLAADSAIGQPSSIKVEATQGRVVLRGTVATAAAVARAREIALGVQGVVAVDNQLTVTN
ncbi:BON domain-containing protein [Roseateles sp.]|uniref:BON domain-containing protein n=1 Tax=Roseateles sp. TaxID=1971397 RepID=UPI00286A6D3C|nr:BON domain-containing protein [Roseateles sp.]